jgi:hypothetical protein
MVFFTIVVPSRTILLMTSVIWIWKLNCFPFPYFQGQFQCHTDLIVEHYSKCRTPSQYICIGPTCISLSYRVHYFESLNEPLFWYMKDGMHCNFYIMCCRSVLNIWWKSKYTWLNYNSKVDLFNDGIWFTLYITNIRLLCRVGSGWCKLFLLYIECEN